MEALLPIDLATLIRSIGYLGVSFIVFAESGLLIGFFLPGDSLLFTAGLLASQGYFSYPLLAIAVFVSAVAGDAVGYLFGKKVGPRIFSRQGSRFFRPEHLRAASSFYEKHGSMAIVLARFMPFVRTFAPIVAGVAGMSYPRFALFNVIGALLWAVGLSALGYGLGETVPGIEGYILPIIALIMILSVSPGIFQLLRDPARRRGALHLISRGRFGSR